MAKVKLGDVVKRIKDTVDKDNTNLEYYVGGEHFENGSLIVNNYGLIKGSTIGPAFSTQFKRGDVLLMSRNPHLRKAGMVLFDGICSDVSYIIRTKDENLLMQKFIPLIFQSNSFWNFAERNKKGSTNFFLNWSDFEKYEFDLPSIETQKKICDLLWSINDTYLSYLEIKQRNNDLCMAHFIDLFGDIFNGDFKYSKVMIKDVVSTKIERASKVFSDDSVIRYIDISSIDNKANRIIGYTEYKKCEAPSRAQQCVKKNDIVVSTVRPNLNNVAMVTDNYNNLVASSGFCVLRCKNIEPEYLFCLVKMKLFADYLSSLTVGANYPAVSDSQILSFEIPLPPLSVQVEFADFIRDIEEMNTSLTNNANNLKNLFLRITDEYIKEE